MRIKYWTIAIATLVVETRNSLAASPLEPNSPRLYSDSKERQKRLQDLGYGGNQQTWFYDALNLMHNLDDDELDRKFLECAKKLEESIKRYSNGTDEHRQSLLLKERLGGYYLRPEDTKDTLIKKLQDFLDKLNPKH